MAVSTAGIVARQRFGDELKRARLSARKPDGAVIKQVDAARAIRRKTIDRVSRFERGAAWPEPKELAALLKLYDADLETRIRLETMLKEGQAISSAWWTEFEDEFAESLIEFVAYEDSAQRITTCAANVVPGLLQTPDYGGVISGSTGKSIVTPHDVERSVELRTNRRRVFDKATSPTVEAIIGEAALRQKIGGVAIMLAQLDSLLEDSAQRGVVFRVLPFEAPAALTYMFHLFEFSGANEKPIAAFDAVTGMSFKKTPKELRALEGYVESLRELAFSAEESLEIIGTIRKEMSRD